MAKSAEGRLWCLSRRLTVAMQRDEMSSPCKSLPELDPILCKTSFTNWTSCCAAAGWSVKMTQS